MSRGAHLLHAVFGTYWAIREDKLESMLAFLDERLEGQRFSVDEIRARIGAARAARDTGKAAASGVAVLPLFGIVSHRAHMVQDISGPGGTSTELFGQEFDTALADPKVGTIVLDIDSPGGSVSGVPELADKIYGARGQKKIIAVANSLAASAAYWIGSAADELVVTPSGELGSIGVFAIHTDTSRRDANNGVQRTLLKAGRHKAEGVPFEPLGSDARAYAQQQIDEFYQGFVEAVARQRGVSTDVARGERFGEGRTVTARQAVDRRMADRVATLEQVLEELGVGAASSTPVRGSRRAAAADDRVLAPAASTLINTSGTAASVAPSAVILLPDARQGASSEPSDSLATTAPQAKEQPVTTSLTPAPGSPGATDDAAAQARASFERQVRIQELCTLAGTTLQQYSDFVASDKTPEEVRAILQAGRAKPSPVVDVQVGADREADRPFASVGEQLSAVIQAGLPGGKRDARLQRFAAVSGMNEGVGSEGGYFLDPATVQTALEPVYNEDPILSRVTETPVGEGRNEVSYQVVDETSRATGSRWGGLQMYWQPEGGAPTPTRPKTRKFKLELKKLMGAAYITEELKEDAPAASTLLNNAFKKESRFMLVDAIWRGPGSGQPLGFLNHASCVSIAIEAGQTINNTPASIAMNTSKMLAAIPADLWGEAIFFYNTELFPYLVTATVGNSPVFINGTGLPGTPPASLWGRPAYPSEFCEAVGTPGDIVCMVPSEYHTAVKDRNARIANSIHVRFLNDEDTLKITQRFDGAPAWKSSVTPFKGAQARSPFVKLAVRV